MREKERGGGSEREGKRVGEGVDVCTLKVPPKRGMLAMAML